jgi:hypothetical protein
MIRQTFTAITLWRRGLRHGNSIELLGVVRLKGVLGTISAARTSAVVAIELLGSCAGRSSRPWAGRRDGDRALFDGK